MLAVLPNDYTPSPDSKVFEGELIDYVITKRIFIYGKYPGGNSKENINLQLELYGIVDNLFPCTAYRCGAWVSHPLYDYVMEVHFHHDELFQNVNMYGLPTILEHRGIHLISPRSIGHGYDYGRRMP